MSRCGKLNLLGILGLPVAAILATMIMFGVRSDIVVVIGIVAWIGGSMTRSAPTAW